MKWGGADKAGKKWRGRGRGSAKMLLGIKTVNSTGGKTNDKDMNAAKMVVTGNPKMTMSKNDSTVDTNNPCCSVHNDTAVN